MLPSGILFDELGKGCRSKMVLQLKGNMTLSSFVSICVEFVEAFVTLGCHPDPLIVTDTNK